MTGQHVRVRGQLAFVRFAALMAVPRLAAAGVEYAVSAGQTAHPGRLIDVPEADTRPVRSM
jgi:hypothetical protein